MLSLAKTEYYEIDTEEFHGDIFTILDAEETEDVLFCYLQKEGWYVIPNSRKGDTMHFEFFVVKPKRGERGLTQVKTGDANISRDWKHIKEKVFLFQPNNRYTEKQSKNVTIVQSNEIINFIKNEIQWMPGWLRYKAKIVNILND